MFRRDMTRIPLVWQRPDLAHTIEFIALSAYYQAVVAPFWLCRIGQNN